VGFTPNQVVAYNLTRAREDKGWTQDEAAGALAPYLGKRWSKASVSQAERSVAGRFIRNFDADEIVAFARAFELPVSGSSCRPRRGRSIPGCRCA
jgi:transcriptional regulator with XRE-family HTH domain